MAVTKKKKSEGVTTEAVSDSAVAEAVPYEPSDMATKEIMIQKNCSREEAIKILKNPATTGS